MVIVCGEVVFGDGCDVSPKSTRVIAPSVGQSRLRIPVQRSSKTRRATYLADHARRFLALSLRNMDVDFRKKAVYSSYPHQPGLIIWLACAAVSLPFPVWAEHGEENAAPTVAMQPSFSGWLAAFRKEAAVKGISEATLDKALNGQTPLDRILELDRKQPEFALPCLATLAFEGRRATFFRAELINVLKIIDAGHIEPSAMVGSWAGAMGQTQFMPSTFLNYAVDFSGDGHIDVWNNVEDALASSANYLAQLGWKSDESWDREVTVPTELDPSLFGGKVRKALPEWAALGLKRADGRALPKRDLQAGLIQLNGRKKRSFLTYANFDAIHEWNRSLQFATTVGLIADELSKVVRKR